MKRVFKKDVGITLIALVITIIVLLILTGVTIAQLTGNGLFDKTKQAKKEVEKAEATETMNLKITNLQIWGYAENKRMPTLQELADGFCKDQEFEYVKEGKEKIASFVLPQIDASNLDSIFVKLKKYPYEFEIDESLKLASIDGVKVSDTNNSGVSTEQYEQLVSRLADLETKIDNIITGMNVSTKTTLYEGTADKANTKYTLKDDISQYKYLIIYTDILSGSQRLQKSSQIIDVSSIKYNSSTEVKDDSHYSIFQATVNTSNKYRISFWFYDTNNIYIVTSEADTWTSPRIYKIDGIK